MERPDVSDRGNLLHNLPLSAIAEQFIPLAEGDRCRIEQIISTGQASPPDFWYDQDETEFVLILQGEAELECEGEAPQILRVGDWRILPPHCRHRVNSTQADPPTVWLAVFYPAATGT
ncbi:cupin domain-containing protein [Synechococcus elongatus IITB4]|uniref:cupin domain-containing protein n=1 Tax=Synechococcus elongatus TaxID=32046 RepID=UPI0030D01366